MGNHGRELVTRLLVVNPSQRVSATSCLSSPWAANANNCHTQLSSRTLSASALRRRERRSRAENGFSTGSSSTRTPSSPAHLAQKGANSHNKLIPQMGHLLAANEEGNQKKPSSAPNSPRQSTTSRRHPEAAVQRLPPS